MHTPKILLLVLALLATTVSLQAQLYIGPGIAYGTEIEELGLQGRIHYRFAAPFRLAGTFIYYLDDIEGRSFSEYNINGHYIFYQGSVAAAHLLAGLNIFRLGIDRGLFNDASRTESGLNLGAGLVFNLGPATQAILDAKYAISDADQLVLGLGLLFRL